MAISAKVDGTKVWTGKVRASYANVFQPRANNEGAEPKYSLCLLIPKTDTETLECMKKAILTAAENGKAKFGNTKLTEKKLLSIIHDGDEDREGAEYKGMYFINASSKQKPGIIDGSREIITDPNDFYSGCYCRCTLNFYAYSAAGNKGVGCGLNNIQKLADGESLSGRAHAEDDFDSVDDETFDFLD